MSPFVCHLVFQVESVRDFFKRRGASGNLGKRRGQISNYLLLVVNGWGQWVNLKVRMGGKYDVEEGKKSGKWVVGLKYWEISLGWEVNFSLVCDYYYVGCDNVNVSAQHVTM